MQTTAVPLFDLAAFERAGAVGRRDLGAEVDRICRSIGFLAITEHGVPEAVIDAVSASARDFFDLPIAEKERCTGPYVGYPYGYIGLEREALARSRDGSGAPDLKESFNGGPHVVPASLRDPEALAFCYAPTPWPDRPNGFRAAWQAYHAAMEGLAARIMRVFALALRLPETAFDPLIDAPISALRALNYPARTAPPKPGQIRAGAHSDYGSLTILLPQEGSRGLEILSPDGEWVEVLPVTGAFVVNIGDLMARWTNDRWVSTLHRVVDAPAGSGGMERRQSLAFFHQPNWDAEIVALASCREPLEPARYPPIRSGPYLMGKFKATAR